MHTNLGLYSNAVYRVGAQKESRNTRVHARKQQRKPVGGGGFGAGQKISKNTPIDTNEDQERPPPPPIMDTSDPPYTNQTQTNFKTTSTEAISSSSNTSSPKRDDVLSTCILSSALIAAFGFGLHELSPYISVAAKDDLGRETLKNILAWPRLSHITLEDIGIVLGTSTFVTLGRKALLSFLPSFKEATDISNNQVLTPLSENPLDVAVVSLLPAISEELLFRGALIPAIYPDIRGVLIAGAVFGALHVNGGRNVVFGIWAAVVGCVYGAAFLASGNVLVPMAAHGLANGASAALWLNEKKKVMKE